MESQSLYQDLIDNHVVVIKKNKKIILKSGLKSNYFVNIKKTISIPFLFQKIINGLCKQIHRISNLNQYAIIGVPYSGIPFAGAIAYELGIPLYLLRSEQNDHGLGNRIEGEITNKKIILVEDVMTTGKSILETVSLLEQMDLNLDVQHVFTIFQRGQLDYQMFSKKQIQYNYLTRKSHETILGKLDELNSLQPIHGKLKKFTLLKKSNIILSIDTDNSNQLYNLIKLLGSHIVGVKIHLDIFPELERANIRAFLKKQKELDQFIVIEDRKFADICSTNIKQMKALETEKYADMIICHGICGFEFAKYSSLPILLVAQLSNQGNLINLDYTEQCIKGASNMDNIVGFISQKNLGYNKALYFKPGIRLNRTEDGLDQQYSQKPTNGIDYYIVGRGILESDDPLGELKKYNNVFCSL